MKLSHKIHPHSLTKENISRLTDYTAVAISLNHLKNNKDFIHPADIAEYLETLSTEKQLSLVQNLPVEEAAEALAELSEDVAGDILEHLDPADAAKIISEMSPDDATDVLDEIDKEHRDALLDNLVEKDAEELRKLLSFDPNTAGGIMNTEVSMFKQDITVDEAITQIRTTIEYKEIIYYAYVIDEESRLVGVLSLRDLMLLKPGTVLQHALNHQDLIVAYYDTDKHDVAKEISHYNLMAIPVIDYEGHLLGVATYDDIIDIIQDEASSDLLGMVGAGQDETVDTPWCVSVFMRLPWLIVNMLTSALSAFVVYLFEGSITHMAILAVLMPMVANQAGNTGQQALAVMIRQLATERFEAKRAWLAVFREGKIGITSGLIMGLFVSVIVMWMTKNVALGCVMGGALMTDMVAGSLAGGAIPLFFRYIGRDPAQASSIFLTAITDSFGFFIFLGLATLFLL